MAKSGHYAKHYATQKVQPWVMDPLRKGASPPENWRSLDEVTQLLHYIKDD